MEILITLDGKRKVTAHLPEGFTVPTDQPVDEGGDGSAPTPFDLYLTALGTCAGVYVEDFCQHRGIPVDRITLKQSAEFTIDAHGKHHLDRVVLKISLPEDFPDKYRSAVAHVAELCAVKRSILNPPEFLVQLEQ